MENKELMDEQIEYDEKKIKQRKVSYKNLFSIKKNFFDENRKAINKNIILLWDYDQNGEIKFSVGEIVDAENGIYVVFNSNKIVVGEPFAGYDFVNQRYYEDTPRKDNIVYSKMYHMPNEDGEGRPASYVYSMTENLFSLHENKNVKDSRLLCFGEFGKTKPEFKFYYNDKNFLLRGGVRPVSMWLDFEKEINKIYKRFIHIGENYLQEDEEIILSEYEKIKKEHEKSMKKFHKSFCGKEKEPDGTITESMYK